MSRRRSACGVVLFVSLIALTHSASTAPRLRGITGGNCGAPVCTWIAFGPYTVTRETGAPPTMDTSFSVANPHTAYTLHAVNEHVSSAEVWVNGVPVLSPSDFNANVTTIDRPIQLELQNTISVELRSQPGASLVLEVVGVDNDPPTVTYTERPPPNSAGWHN